MKKLIIKLNEEVEGLKFVQVNDGFVIVDLNKRGEEGVNYNFGLLKIDNLPNQYIKYSTEWNCCRKIIFATSNLNLEGVPLIEEKELNWSATTYLKSHNLERGKSFNFWKSIVKGAYRQAQKDLFTEEQVMEAIVMSRLRIKQRTEIGDKYGKEINRYMYIDEIIEHLKQPKVEITFENDVPVKCVMI